ncbi:hypothetical protein QBC41DRAFT_330747 [Cercophora samala]|uniref:Uncharacterized protein n=1 Tax=Cercophora samala TaxID=330535 RepID=A0AA39YZ58_9PEZI|nr:hypothetical protein QBC41DRAFT_330747 [Cercophora samala]
MYMDSSLDDRQTFWFGLARFLHNILSLLFLPRRCSVNTTTWPRITTFLPLHITPRRPSQIRPARSNVSVRFHCACPVSALSHRDLLNTRQPEPSHNLTVLHILTLWFPNHPTLPPNSNPHDRRHPRAPGRRCLSSSSSPSASGEPRPGLCVYVCVLRTVKQPHNRRFPTKETAKEKRKKQRTAERLQRPTGIFPEAQQFIVCSL